MRLTDVSAYALSSPIDPPQSRPFHGGVRHLRKRDVVLVVVETADGERGFAPAGASSSAMREFFEGASQAAFADLVSGRVADALVGSDLEDVADAHDAVAELDLPAKLAAQAAGAIDVALHDLKGKRVGAPVCELLGGAEETRLPLYASAGMYMEPEGFVEQAEALAEHEFWGYKYRPGIGPEADRETMERLVAAVGDEMRVLADAHTWWKLREGYDAATVRDLATDFADAGATWVEEPVAPDDYDGYRDLAAAGVPLAGGESEETVDGLLALADTGAVDFLQGDVRHHAGFTGCMRAVDHVEGTDVEFVPHNFGTWLGLVANAHLVAAAPEVRLLEYPVFEGDPALGTDEVSGMYPFDLAFDVLAEDLEVEGGHFEVPDGPGLGVEVDLSVVEEYPFREGAWTEFEYEGEDG